MIDISNNIPLFLYLLLPITMTILALWLLNRNKVRHLTDEIVKLNKQTAVDSTQLENKDKQIDSLNNDIERQKAENRSLQQDIETNKIATAKLKTQLDEEKKSTQEKLNLLGQAENRMVESFENLSNKILEEKSKKFTEHNKNNIGEMLNPLREQLGNFRKKIEDVYDKETKDRMSLYHEITHLKSLNEQMSKDAINLTKALKGNSKKRGDWGEVILQRVLEESGLKNGREYDVQTSHRDETNKLLRPDVIVHLPNNRDVIIDSKISLNAYERYYSTEAEDDKKQAIRDHLNSIRTHVDDLESKHYDELIGVNSLDMVLMFVAIEPALMLAFEHDDALFQYAFNKRIFLVSPSTLSMNLQIIQNMWRYEYQNQNVQEIAKKAGDMYNKFAGFVESLENIGDKLNKAQIAYQKAHDQLANGRGNLVARAEAIRKLGNLKTNKSLPEELQKKSLLSD